MAWEEEKQLLGQCFTFETLVVPLPTSRLGFEMGGIMYDVGYVKSSASDQAIRSVCGDCDEEHRTLQFLDGSQVHVGSRYPGMERDPWIYDVENGEILHLNVETEAGWVVEYTNNGKVETWNSNGKTEWVIECVTRTKRLEMKLFVRPREQYMLFWLWRQQALRVPFDIIQLMNTWLPKAGTTCVVGSYHYKGEREEE
eukprot:TRINITY_DN6379_c0_g1_i1.p1 TRINITY_DN6379_c0_g1~~TRINITY_DN6379_c0_g1_i1.p1  ORF type:complete len:198 (-),score=8.98 TRINITY_DN6379_c0_g1_i1:241-834(-)